MIDKRERAGERGNDAGREREEESEGDGEARDLRQGVFWRPMENTTYIWSLH